MLEWGVPFSNQRNEKEFIWDRSEFDAMRLFVRMNFRKFVR